MLIVNARFLTQELTGVQRFAIELSKQLKKIFASEIVFVSPIGILDIVLGKELDIKIVGTRSGHLWEQIDLPKYLKKNDNPLLLNLCNTAPLFYKNKIITVHDIAYERFPQNFNWKFSFVYKHMIPFIVHNSKHIFTVSEFSKNEISHFYNKDKKYISVVYNAVNNIFAPQKKENQEKYILAVSSLNYQKNFHSLIKSFNLLEDKKVKLFLVGGINKSFANLELLKDIESNINIVFKGRVNDSELISLYSNAIVFVFPSLYEGFGIPPLEAQACGTPVVCSDVASLPEVGGENSVIYCEPYSVESIREKISLVLNDKKLQNSLREKGFKNVNRFSWEKSASKVVEIIKRLK